MSTLAWLRSSSASALALTFLVTATGCSKLKGALGRGEDGGTASSGGGVLSFLGSDFEGEITSSLTTKDKTQKGVPQKIVFGIRKPRFRIDTSGNGPTDPRTPGATAGSFIVDPPTKKGWMLLHPQKMAVVVDFEKLKSMPTGKAIPGLPSAPRGAPTAMPSQPPTIEKTGKKDVVAGYGCDVWNVVSEGKKAEVCVAEGITWFDVGDIGLASPELAIAAVATEANRFPLRLVSFDAKGVEQLRMEATKIEKKKLDDARFIVPPDYRTVDMAAMFGALGGLPSGIPTFPPPKTR